MRDDATTASAVVVAVDGLVFDTLPVRARALIASLELEKLTVIHSEVHARLPGRSFSEVIDLLSTDGDATARDIAALRAQQMYARDALAGVSLQHDALAWLHAMRARGIRVIGRADSTRRDMERLSRTLALGDVFTMLRCADDEPRPRGASMLESAYMAIRDRVHRMQPDATIDGYETTPDAAATAARYVRSAMCNRLCALGTSG